MTILTVETVEELGRTRVIPKGEIDIATVDDLGSALAARSGGDLVLDLGAVTFLDSSALRLFVEQHRAAAAGGWSFALANLTPRVERLLDIAGLSDRFEVVSRNGDDPPAG
jgi:anti-sigma B factor antagonist